MDTHTSCIFFCTPPVAPLVTLASYAWKMSLLFWSLGRMEPNLSRSAVAMESAVALWRDINKTKKICLAHHRLCQCSRSQVPADTEWKCQPGWRQSLHSWFLQWCTSKSSFYILHVGEATVLKFYKDTNYANLLRNFKNVALNGLMFLTAETMTSEECCLCGTRAAESSWMWAQHASMLSQHFSPASRLCLHSDLSLFRTN